MPRRPQVAQQLRPGIGGLPLAVGDRHQLLGAVGAHPHQHQAAQPAVLQPQVEVDPVRPAVHVIPVGQAALGEPRPSACHWVVSLVMTEADRPAAAPKNASRAGTKSRLDSPCRYSSGSTSATLGLRRHQRGSSPLWNCTR
jgi:hypothetical protein